MFGGYKSYEAEYNANLYSLDLDKMEWQKIFESKGSPNEPVGRSNFDLVNDGTCLWMFGGIQDHHTLDDFWKFDLKTSSWAKI